MAEWSYQLRNHSITKEFHPKSRQVASNTDKKAIKSHRSQPNGPFKYASFNHNIVLYSCSQPLLVKIPKGASKDYFFEPQIVERQFYILELIGFRVMFQSASQTIRNTFL